MTFAYPWVFILFLPALVFLLRRWAELRRNGVTISSITPASGLPATPLQRLAWLPLAARILAVLFLVTALARPQREHLESTLERDGIAIELLVDVSSSMEMRMQYGDRTASRLFVAKEVLRDFIHGNASGLAGRPNDLIGMITFARYADTVCPLTHSHEALTYLTDQLTINDRPNEDGTAYGDATALAAARLARLEESFEGSRQDPAEVKSRIIVLLTDGENNCGRMLPQQAAALAAEWGIRIYTISLTDPPQSQFVRVDGEETIEVARSRSAAERGLEAMASSTGGIFRTAYDFDTLQAVYTEIDRLERSRMKSATRRVPQECFAPFAFAALAFITLEFLLQSLWFRLIP